MNTRCPPKRVPSAVRFFILCRLTVQPPQSCSIGGQRSSGQLTGKPAGAQPDYRGRWCAFVDDERSDKEETDNSEEEEEEEEKEKEKKRRGRVREIKETPRNRPVQNGHPTINNNQHQKKN
ncbi:UNVERIFIED_CONTAM: hypothetical protein FKN15_023067 [Acipenser sinensis]